MSSEPTIGLKVSLIARMLRTRFDARARGIGLTRAQWRMIVTIKMAEGATQSHLASRLEINSVTAGRIIDRLQAAGCVERRADPIDRRVNRVHLTPDATSIMAKLAALGQEEEQTTVDGLSAAEREQLGRLLQHVIDNIQRAPMLEGDEDADAIDD